MTERPRDRDPHRLRRFLEDAPGEDDRSTVAAHLDAASLSHDHVVTIHAVDERKGLPYLVMSFIAGRSLRERLDLSGPMTPRESKGRGG